MVSFWSNKPDDEDESSRGRQGVIPQPRPEPDERTALLHDGYLDPDDPAVCLLFLSLIDLLMNYRSLHITCSKSGSQDGLPSSLPLLTLSGGLYF